MILTDLNIDCLEAILEYLKFEDLLNVADSNKRLRHASKFVFVHKYAERSFRYFGTYYQTMPIKNVIPDFERINIQNLKSILQLLRIFGPFIYRIRMNTLIETDIRYIGAYINEFCSETLSDLNAFICYEDLVDCLKSPFTNVKIVEIGTRFLTKKNSLVHLFPNIQKFTLQFNFPSVFTMHSECLADHFPYLEHFEIRFSNGWDYKKDAECTEVIKTFLRFNPQLKHIYLECRNLVENNIFEIFSERDQNPERLELYDISRNLFNLSHVKKWRLKNVKHLLIYIDCFAESFEGRIPFVCSQLETFEICGYDPLNECIYDFCKNNSTIRKLIIARTIDFVYSDTIWINFWIKLAQCLPLLEEITNSHRKLSVVEAIQVLSLFKCLKYFYFDCSEHFECEQLQSHLNDNWSIQFTTERRNNFIILKR